MQDLQAFRNILPESIYARLGNPAASVEDRLDLFFGRDFAIYDGNTALKGSVMKMGPGTRIKRDAVSGQPLPEDGMRFPVNHCLRMGKDRKWWCWPACFFRLSNNRIV